MTAPRFVNLFIEPNPNCPEGCSQRFQAASAARTIRLIRYSSGGAEAVPNRLRASAASNAAPSPASPRS